MCGRSVRPSLLGWPRALRRWMRCLGSAAWTFGAACLASFQPEIGPQCSSRRTHRRSGTAGRRPIPLLFISVASCWHSCMVASCWRLLYGCELHHTGSLDCLWRKG